MKKYMNLTNTTFALLIIILSACNKDGDINSDPKTLTESKEIVDSAPTTLTDVDGNTYQTLAIGEQVWMAENLKVTHFNDGVTPIPLLEQTSDWDNVTLTHSPAYCWYDDGNPNTPKDKYGALYNWHAVSTGNLAPIGWHVPTEAEWNTLKAYLISAGYNYNPLNTVDNMVAKSLASTTEWQASQIEGAIGMEPNKNNSTGFTALAGGMRYRNGDFKWAGSASMWWSATSVQPSDVNGNAYFSQLHSETTTLLTNATDKDSGFYVRCIRD
jgi:uncharacterized protein (TIGR02145 family)